MGGCTNCKGKDACDDHKGSMMGSVEAALAALYPTKTWGEIDEPPIDPVGEDELAGLAEELATELRAATFVRPGSDDEACDYIYILCLGRAPCIVQVRDHEVGVPAEWVGIDGASPADAGLAIDELYLRIVVAHRSRHCAVQQVAITAVRGDDGFVVRESPRAGVYDAPLLSRMQKLVAILPAYGLVHVDFGDIAHAPPEFSPGAWAEAYGLGSARPSIANYLFYPQPTTMVTTTFVPAGEAT